MIHCYEYLILHQIILSNVNTYYIYAYVFICQSNDFKSKIHDMNVKEAYAQKCLLMTA